jgi:hypothetical protein
MKITQGQIVAITSGEYSDYCLRDHMRALKDFDAKVEADRFREAVDVPGHEGQVRFLSWTITEGLMETLDDASVVELHIGCWGELEISER